MEFIATYEQVNQLARIYNTLLNISTKGEDTLVMADCLRAFEAVVNEISKNKKEEATAPEFMPVEE